MNLVSRVENRAYLLDEDIKAQAQARTQAQKEAQDPIQGLGGPMTRARARKAQEAVKHVIISLLEAQPQFEAQYPNEAQHMNLRVYTCIAHLE